MNLKVYGERNTGTNYIQRLIEKNTNAKLLQGTITKKVGRVLLKLDKFSFLHIFSEKIRDLYFDYTSHSNLGWKHMEVDLSLIKENSSVNDDTIFVCVVKNPYSWILSLYDKPYHQYDKSKNLDEFIISKWKTVKRENAQNLHYENVVDMWNCKVKSYFELKDTLKDKVIILKYEDFLENYTLVLDELKRRNIQVVEDISNITGSTKEKRKNNEYYKDYYLNEKWKKKYTKNEIDTINKFLDENIMEKLNYEKI